MYQEVINMVSDMPRFRTVTVTGVGQRTTTTMSITLLATPIFAMNSARQSPRQTARMKVTSSTSMDTGTA